MKASRFHIGVSSFAMIVAATASEACAQDAASGVPVEASSAPVLPQAAAPAETAAADIIVTGSRIARRDYVAQSPIVTTTVAALENAGVATVDAALIQLPQFQPGSGGFTNQSQGGLGVGQATLNLRGLQAVRTLVLLDGRRLEPGNASNVIDTNTIPSSAIGGVEVITGGASATYGSDAIAGVVNFKLRRKFQGFEVNAQSGISEVGDAATHQIAFIAGTKFAGGKGSVMLAGEYADRAAVGYRDRAFSTPTGAPAGTLPNGFYSPSSANLPTQAAVNTVFGRYGAAPGTVARTANLGVNGDATLFRSALTPTNYKSTGDPCIVNTPTLFGYDGFCTNNLQSALNRYSSLARAEYEISPALNLFVQGTYARSNASGQGSHPTIAAFGSSGLTIPIGNPFIPGDLRAILASRANPADSFTYVKRFTDAGPRAFTNTTDTYQILVGANGKLGQWDYELYGTHGKTFADDRSIKGSISISAMQRLVSAPDGGASLCSGGFNIFGPNPVSASCVAYVQRDTLTRTTIGQDELAGSISGKLFALPAGDVKAAVSANYRRNTYTVRPDAALQAGDIAAVVAVQPTTGQTKVAEGAVEFLIPLLKDVPLIESFNFTPGYRYSKYSPGGGVSTYKANFDWTVTSGILFRGGYQHAVRAPNIGELYQAPSALSVNIGVTPAAGDPCDVRSSYRTGANAAAVRTLCLAQGVPTAVIDSFNQVNGGIQAISQGNSALTPEKANSFTAGVVLQPKGFGAAFRRMSLSVDYYNIQITDVIATVDVPTSIAKCFNADGSNTAYSAANLYCANLLRSTANGQIVGSYQSLQNIGGYRTDGIDVQFDWGLPTDSLGLGGNGAFNLNATVNYLNKFEISQRTGAPYQDYAGAIGPSSAPGSIQSFARWKGSSSLSYDSDVFQIGVRWRYFGAFRDISTVTNAASTIAGTRPASYFDLNGRIRATRAFELRGGVTNLANRQPQIVSGVSGVTNLGIYDPIGRAFYVGAKVKF